MPSPEELASVESASAPDFYTWTFPGAPVRIHFYLDVVERLSREVRRAFESIPSRGVEIGGLLLGTADLYASHIIEIKAFEPFLCEYRSDHKFILSGSDRRKLEKTLSDRGSTPADQFKVVGYYRSHLGDGLSLSQDDLALIQAYFYDPASVFLLVKPSSDGSSSAGFFFWDNDRIDSEFTFLEFPFDARQLTGARVKPSQAGAQRELDLEQPLAGAASAPEFLTDAVPSTFEQPAAGPGEPPGRKPGRLWFTLFAALMIVVGALGYQAYMRWRVSPAPAPVSDAPALILQVERRGSDLRVAWNRISSVIRRAKEAVLSIRDGHTQEQALRLDLDQLRTGSVLYTPAAGSVLFRLEVTGEDGSKTSESVLWLAALTPAAPAAASPPVSNRSTAQPPVASKTTFTPPASQGGFGDPVHVVIADPLPQNANPSTQPFLMPQPKLGSAPSATPYQTGTATLSSAVPFVPPRPIRESQPSLPPSVRALVTSLVEVQVKVDIDESGRVVKAEPVASTGPVSSFLVSAARNAAQLWIFEPARRGDQAVLSQMILKFQYRPVKRSN